MYLSHTTILPFSKPTAITFVSSDIAVAVILHVKGHTRSGLNSMSAIKQNSINYRTFLGFIYVVLVLLCNKIDKGKKSKISRYTVKSLYGTPLYNIDLANTVMLWLTNFLTMEFYKGL